MRLLLLRNTAIRRVLRRWITSEEGQDLIEYALLAGFLSFAAIGAVNLLSGSMADTYNSWVNGTDALTEVPEP